MLKINQVTETGKNSFHNMNICQLYCGQCHLKMSDHGTHMWWHTPVWCTHQQCEWWPQKKGICSHSFSGAQSEPPDDTHSSKVWKTAFTQTIKTMTTQTHSAITLKCSKNLLVPLFPSSQTWSVVISEAQEVVVWDQTLNGVTHHVYINWFDLCPIS